MKTLRHTSTETNIGRRSFLRYAGAASAAAASALALSACHKGNASGDGDNIDTGAGDIGILNYVYALKQVQAAFYIKVVSLPYTGISATETALLTDICNHEVAHRECYHTALGVNAIPLLQADFSSINFLSRIEVLTAAQAFEDMSVSAYNGAGCLIQDANYLMLIGKVVSVEARHASLVRNLLSFGSYADSTVLDINSLDKARSVAQVLPVINSYLITKVSAHNFNYVA